MRKSRKLDSFNLEPDYGEFNHEALFHGRKNKGFTQRAVSDLLCIPINSFNHYEKGKKCPRAATIHRICNLYGIKPSDVLSGQALVRYEAWEYYTKTMNKREMIRRIREKNARVRSKG